MKIEPYPIGYGHNFKKRCFWVYDGKMWYTQRNDIWIITGDIWIITRCAPVHFTVWTVIFATSTVKITVYTVKCTEAHRNLSSATSNYSNVASNYSNAVFCVYYYRFQTAEFNNGFRLVIIYYQKFRNIASKQNCLSSTF